MEIKKLLISFLLLFIWLGQSVAENPEEYCLAETSSYIFRYNSFDGYSVNNLFIQEIARLNFLNLYQTEYSLDYDLEMKISVLPGNKLEVKSRLIIRKLDGDVFYKDFNLSDVMVPTGFAFKLHISYGSKRVEEIYVNDLIVPELNETTVQLATAYLAGRLIFEISDLEFKYHENDKTVFDKRISDINDYLALGQLSVFQLGKAELIDPEDADMLLSNYLKIYDLERYLSIVSKELAEIPFIIPADYEKSLNKNLKTLDSHKRRLNTLFDQTLNSSVLEIDDDALTRASGVLIGLQMDYMLELNKQSFFYEPVYQYLAGFFNNDSSVQQLTGNLNGLFGFSRPMGNSAETLEAKFKNILLENYMHISDSLILEEKFHEAVILLESAEAVCRSVNSIECGLLIYNKLSTSKWGIYDAYIRVAQSAMEAINLDMSRNYLEIASAFQLDNKNFITTNGFTLVEYEKLGWEYFQQGNSWYKSEQYEDAVISYTQAREIYRMLGVMKYDEVILKKITNATQRIDQNPEADDNAIK
jgi:tetratricopeptide (TPR) repeat protein